nr:MAG TPA: hypothetical protein [Caudoviricetes sp.]
MTGQCGQTSGAFICWQGKRQQTGRSRRRRKR